MDVHLSHLVHDQRLCELLSHYYECQADDVRLIEELCTTDQFDDCTVLAQRLSRAGDFPLSISILSAPQGCIESDSYLAIQLCKLAQCFALVADSSPDPYKWVILDGLGNQTEVLVDGDAMDDQDAFIIPDERRPTWFFR
ncbi:MAG: hypothetical protein AAF483_13560 [Planctomycetota bacterium]